MTKNILLYFLIFGLSYSQDRNIDNVRRYILTLKEKYLYNEDPNTSKFKESIINNIQLKINGKNSLLEKDKEKVWEELINEVENDNYIKNCQCAYFSEKLDNKNQTTKQKAQNEFYEKIFNDLYSTARNKLIESEWADSRCSDMKFDENIHKRDAEYKKYSNESLMNQELTDLKNYVNNQNTLRCLNKNEVYLRLNGIIKQKEIDLECGNLKKSLKTINNIISNGESSKSKIDKLNVIKNEVNQKLLCFDNSESIIKNMDITIKKIECASFKDEVNGLVNIRRENEDVTDDINRLNNLRDEVSKSECSGINSQSIDDKIIELNKIQDEFICNGLKNSISDLSNIIFSSKSKKSKINKLIEIKDQIKKKPFCLESYESKIINIETEIEKLDESDEWVTDFIKSNIKFIFTIIVIVVSGVIFYRLKYNTKKPNNARDNKISSTFQVQKENRSGESVSEGFGEKNTGKIGQGGGFPSNQEEIVPPKKLFSRLRKIITWIVETYNKIKNFELIKKILRKTKGKYTHSKNIFESDDETITDQIFTIILSLILYLIIPAIVTWGGYYLGVEKGKVEAYMEINQIFDLKERNDEGKKESEFLKLISKEKKENKNLLPIIMKINNCQSKMAKTELCPK